MKRRKVLLLDDDQSRIRAFLERMQPHPHEVYTVATAAACIEHLAEDVWDLVLLDHDLGGEVFVASTRIDTGAEVVRWLESNVAPHGSFIVHSMNPVGAAGMYFDLQALGYKVTQAPFGSAEFWSAVYRELEIRRTPREKRVRVVDRISAYVRSIRAGGRR